MNSAHPAAPPDTAAPAARFLALGPLLAVLLMGACLGLSVWLKPTRYWADHSGAPDLENLVPKTFGDWVESPFGSGSVVNPQIQEAIGHTYTGTLARTYIHRPSGRMIMLSLAWGRDQDRDTQLHRPEMCYRTQGFRVDSLLPAELRLSGKDLIATRMDATLALRHEPTTYVIRIGEYNVLGSLQMNLARMHYAVQGYIADGMLFRVSEITGQPAAEAYRLQDRFIADLLAHIPPDAQRQLVGSREP